MAGLVPNQSFQQLPVAQRGGANHAVPGAHDLSSVSCPEFRARRQDGDGVPPRAQLRDAGVLGVVNMAAGGMAHSFSGFAKMRATNTLVDVHFVVGGHTIPAHRCVVASHSQPLTQMLSNPSFHESSQLTIALKDTDPTHFATLVDCMYGMPVVIRKEQVLGLLAEADKWQVQFVKEECARALQAALHPTTCWEVLAAAEQFALPGLKAEALRFVCVNFGDAVGNAGFLGVAGAVLTEVLGSDLLWLHHEMTIFKACWAWLLHSHDRHPLAMQMLSHVRFGRMRQDDIQSLRGLLGQAPDPLKTALNHMLVSGPNPAHLHPLPHPLPQLLPHHNHSHPHARAPGVVEGVDGFRPRRCTGAKCQVVLRGHNDSVTAVMFAKNLLISASSDTTIKVWDTSTWTLKCTLIGHTGWVTALCVVGDLLVSGSDDQTLRVWDMATWNCVRVLHRDTDWINALVVVDGKLVSGGAELVVWDCATWELVGVLAKEDEIQAMVVAGGYLFSTSMDNAIRVWDVGTWQCVHVMRGHTDAVHALAVVDGKLFSGSEDMTIRMWDCRTFQCERTVKETEVVTALAVVDGKLVSGTNDDMVKVWDMHTWQCEYAMPECAESVNTEFINGLAIHNGRVAVAAADGNIRLLVPE